MGYIWIKKIGSPRLLTYTTLKKILTFGSSPFVLAKSRLGPDFSSILQYLCPIKSPCFSKNFDNVIACDLRFGPPLQSKILASPTYPVNVFS